MSFASRAFALASALLLAACAARPTPPPLQPTPFPSPTPVPVTPPPPANARAAGVTSVPPAPTIYDAWAQRALSAFRTSCPVLIRRQDQSGLAQGDIVVTDGQDRLSVGSKVTVKSGPGHVSPQSAKANP